MIHAFSSNKKGHKIIKAKRTNEASSLEGQDDQKTESDSRRRRRTKKAKLSWT